MEKLKKTLNLKSRPSDLTLTPYDTRSIDADTFTEQDNIAPLPSSSSRKSSPSIHQPSSASTYSAFPPRTQSIKSPPLGPNSDVSGRDNPLPPLPPEAAINYHSTPSTRLLGSPLQSSDGWRRPPTASSSSEDKIDTIIDFTVPGSSEPLDYLTDLLFSEDHLRIILNDSSIFARFTVFLNHFRPHSVPVLVRYLEARKAVKAVEYANSLAHLIPQVPGDRASLAPCAAATVNPRFEQWCRTALDELASDILPAYVTYNLTKVVRDCLVKETMGMQTPLMRSLVDGLNDAFWVSDPNLEDCPIVYASDEFLRLTRYGREIIGTNCRFLQGNRTSHYTANRLARAVKLGQEVSETMLTYRQDGTAFVSLITLAPLVDDNAMVKYFLGTMVDISGLIEHGRGLESFEKTLNIKREAEDKQHKPSWTSHDTKSQENGVSPSTEVFNEPTAKNAQSEDQSKNDPLEKLVELAEMLSIQESGLVRACIRKSSVTQRGPAGAPSVRSLPGRQGRQGRRVLMDFPRSDSEGETARAITAPGNRMSIAATVSSDSLPAVYQEYLLIRPAPTLRVIFASPSVESPENIVQTPFMSHVSGPKSTLDGLKDSFASGVPVTAKVTWHPMGKSDAIFSRYDAQDYQARRRSASIEQNSERIKPQKRWISATPLYGADGRIGVWMVALIEPPSTRPSMSSRNTPQTGAARHSASASRSTKRASNRLSMHSAHGGIPNTITNINTSSRRRIVPAAPSIASSRLSVASYMSSASLRPRSARGPDPLEDAIGSGIGSGIDEEDIGGIMSDGGLPASRPHTGHGSRPTVRGGGGVSNGGFDHHHSQHAKQLMRQRSNANIELTPKNSNEHAGGSTSPFPIYPDASQLRRDSEAWPEQMHLFNRAIPGTPDSLLDKFPQPSVVGHASGNESNKENSKQVYHGRRRGSSF